MYHHWGCTSINRTLSYPFRSLTITPSIQVKIKVHVQQDGNLEDDLQQPPSAPGKKILRRQESTNFVTSLLFGRFGDVCMGQKLHLSRGWWYPPKKSFLRLATFIYTDRHTYRRAGFLAVRQTNRLKQKSQTYN